MKCVPTKRPAQARKTKKSPAKAAKKISKQRAKRTRKSGLTILYESLAKLDVDAKTRLLSIEQRLDHLDGDGGLREYVDHLHQLIRDVLSFPGVAGWVAHREQDRLDQIKRDVRRRKRQEREAAREEQKQGRQLDDAHTMQTASGPVTLMLSPEPTKNG
jgi:hypothetical protein